MDRCTGHCCKDIGLTVSPAELRSSYMRFVETQGGQFDRTPIKLASRGGGLSSYDRQTVYEDIHLLFPMLIFTHSDNKHPDEPNREFSHDTVYHYKCKHFDGENCTIYDIRPRTCSSFAMDKGGCGYKDCTWTEACDRRKERDKVRGALTDGGDSPSDCKKLEC